MVVPQNMVIGFDWPIPTLDSPSIFQTPALWGRLPATESSCTSFIMAINHVFELGRLECTSVCWFYKRHLHWCWLYGLCFFWRFLIYHLSIHLPLTLEVNLVNGEPPHWNGKLSTCIDHQNTTLPFAMRFLSSTSSTVGASCTCF